MFTVVIMEPCCEKTEPGYDPGPRPVWHRFPHHWPPRCNHRDKRILTITEHETRESAEAEHSKTLGWDSLTGYMFEGKMPPEGERFRVMGVSGTLTGIRGYTVAKPGRLLFPTVEMAEEWAEKTRTIFYNIVGDQDTRVRLSSYRVKVGTELECHEPA